MIIMKNYKMFIGVLFRNVEGDYLVCDIKLRNAYTKIEHIYNSKIVNKYPAQRIEGVKIKLDTNNQKIVDKAKELKKRRIIWLELETDFPLGNRFEKMMIVKLLTNQEYMDLYIPYLEESERVRKANEETFRKNHGAEVPNPFSKKRKHKIKQETENIIVNPEDYCEVNHLI